MYNKILWSHFIKKIVFLLRKISTEAPNFQGFIESAPPPNPKKLDHMPKLWAYYGLSNPARKKFWALFSNEKTIIQKWGC